MQSAGPLVTASRRSCSERGAEVYPFGCVSVKGQQKRLGHSPQAFHLAEEWRVTLSGYNLDLLHSCPSAFGGLLIQSRRLDIIRNPVLLVKRFGHSICGNFAVVFAPLTGPFYKCHFPGRSVIIRKSYLLVKRFGPLFRGNFAGVAAPTGTL